MTKLEEVARAIQNSGGYTPDWQGADEDLIIMARAAVQAMRSLEGHIPDAVRYAGYPNGRAMYEAMIDAILNEKP